MVQVNATLEAFLRERLKGDPRRWAAVDLNLGRRSEFEWVESHAITVRTFRGVLDENLIGSAFMQPGNCVLVCKPYRAYPWDRVSSCLLYTSPSPRDS